jgi:two-component system, OmpR family, response regulator
VERNRDVRTLLAEDDPELGSYVRRSLVAEGHDVDLFTSGSEALSAALAGSHDLLILDRMLPGRDGLAILKDLRALGSTTPVILLTAMGSVEDRVEGLRAGADDYMVKPIAVVELLARIDNIFRRPAQTPAAMELVVGDLQLDLLRRSALRAGQEIELLTREFLLLKHFMERRGQVQTRTMLLEAVWGLTFDPRTSVVETHVSRLRNKIDKPFDEPYLVTLHGVGYVFKP